MRLRRRSHRSIVARPRRHTDSGFSLLELMLTIGIIGLVTSMSVVQILSARQAIRGDSGMRLVLAQLNTARELSISQRRNIQVRFVGVNWIQIVRNEVPVGTTVLSSRPFEGNVEFALVPGLPDTPDAFGRNAAIDFGAAQAVMFSSDGTLIDNGGSPVNGTIYIAANRQARSARAITVLGSTGRVRAYRWNGSQWVRL